MDLKNQDIQIEIGESKEPTIVLSSTHQFEGKRVLDLVASWETDSEGLFTELGAQYIPLENIDCVEEEETFDYILLNSLEEITEIEESIKALTNKSGSRVLLKRLYSYDELRSEIMPLTEKGILSKYRIVFERVIDQEEGAIYQLYFEKI